MVSRRQKRVEELLRVEIGRVIYRELSDSVTPLMSITGVEVSKDLNYAKVFVSFLDGVNRAKHVAKLTKAEGFIRSELNKVIRLKRIPNLDFRIDESIANAFKLEDVFSRIKEEDEQTGNGDSE